MKETEKQIDKVIYNQSMIANISIFKAMINRLEVPRVNKKQLSKEIDREFLKSELEAGRICLRDYMTAMGTVINNIMCCIVLGTL